MSKFNPKSFYETKEEIPEGLSGLYEKTKNKDDEEIYSLKKEVSNALSATGLKKQIQKLKELNKTKEVKPKEDDDIPDDEPEDIPEDIPTKAKQNNKEYLKQLAKNKALEKQILNIKNDLSKKDDASKALLLQLIKSEQNQKVIEAIKSEGGSVPLLKDFVNASVGHETTNGVNSFFIKDAEGNQEYIGSEVKSIKDFVNELKENKDYSQAFSNKTKGVGTDDFKDSKNHKINIDNVGSFEKLNNDERAEYIKTFGSEAYLKAGERLIAEKVLKIEQTNKEMSPIPEGVI